MKLMLRSIVDKVKSWFNYAWSIFLARLDVVSGFIIGVIGAIDWAGFASIDFDAGFSHNQMFWISIGLVIRGIVAEVGRRSGTVTTTAGQLVPENIAKKADIEIKE